MLKRENGPPPAARPDAPGSSVQRARTRARQRLIGALLLLTVGVIGFPLLFESRPRPIPVDIPIDIPSRETAAPLVVPDAAGERGSSAAAAAMQKPPPSSPPPEVIEETSADAGRDVTAPAALMLSPSASASGSVATQTPPLQPAVRAVAKSSTPSTPPADTNAGRAQALLDGRPLAKTSASAPAAPASTAARPGDQRYIIQVGAFADPVAARDTRLKVERLGLKTYTQVADTPAGPRTRVRVGPFVARADADKAMARVKAAGVAAAILTL